MLTNKLTNMIFSNSDENGSSLHVGVQEVLDGINNCLSITNRVQAVKETSNTAFKETTERLQMMLSEIKEINLERTSGKVFRR